MKGEILAIPKKVLGGMPGKAGGLSDMVRHMN